MEGSQEPGAFPSRKSLSESQGAPASLAGAGGTGAVDPREGFGRGGYMAVPGCGLTRMSWLRVGQEGTDDMDLR